MTLDRETDVLLVFTPVGGGHRAAALATKDALEERGVRATVIDLFAHAPRWVTESYAAGHRTGQSYLPTVYGYGYRASNRRGGSYESFRRRLDALLFGRLEAAVAAHGPRAIVATHHLPLVVLGERHGKSAARPPLLAVVTDHTAHAHWAEQGVDGFCVSGDVPRSDLIVHGIEPEVVHRTGIPIRAAFEKVLTLGDVSVRAPLRVLVTGGGFGVGPMRRIVRSFRGMTDVRLTVVCGHSQRLRAQVAADAAEYGLALEAVGFEPDMAARVSDAHVVIGKPGGLTVTETLAAGRPMVVVSATPGHEEANERLVVDGGAGIAVDADEAGSRTRELWYAHALGAMGARARRLVAPGAASRVADLVMEAAKLALPASATRMRLRRALAA